MKTAIHVTIALCVMGLAIWAYQQNYATQAALRDTHLVREELVVLRERLRVLRAEWAYLNRPDRLRDLANLNYDRLQLFEVAPEQFGMVDEIAFPSEAAQVLTDIVEARGTNSQVSR